MRLYSYAKLNLYLKVIRKRKDNYHSLKTLFERINLKDTISLESRPDSRISLYSDSKDIPTDQTNLAWRAALLLQEKTGIKKGVAIRILKRIPVGAGLGGGSGNAAAVLLGLNKLWNLRLRRAELLNFASKLGSDVPFFIYQVPFAQGSGRGDRVEPVPSLEIVKFWHVLCLPRVHVATPQIYSQWDKYKKNKKAALTIPRANVTMLCYVLKKKRLSCVAKALYNNLEPVTCALYPQVQDIKDTMVRFGAQAVRMSGRGPTVFAMLSSRTEAVSLYKYLKEKNHSWRAYIVRTA